MTFSIDFNKAYRQADALAQSAEQLRQESNRISEIANETQRNWIGETAEAFFAKLQILESELREGASRAKQDAAAFRARIDAIREAEEMAMAAMKGESNA